MYKPKQTLNPCHCSWCKTPTGQMIALGVQNRIYTCGKCSTSFLGAVWPGACPACDAKAGHVKYIRPLGLGESIPGDLCETCQEKSKGMMEKIHQGGIMYRCKKCHTQGIIEGDTDYARNIRLKVGKPAPEEVGIEIDDCEQCMPAEEGEAAHDHEHDAEGKCLVPDGMEFAPADEATVAALLDALEG